MAGHLTDTITFMRYLIPSLFAFLLLCACNRAPSADEIAGWKSFTQPNYHITVPYPPDWSVDTTYCELCLRSPDGENIRFFYKPVRAGSSWEAEGKWYANSSGAIVRNGTREIESLVLTEQDPLASYVEELVTPIFNGKGYIKLSMDCPQDLKESAVKTLYTMERHLGIPDAPSTDWQLYTDDRYGFTFTYPPGTEVVRYDDGEKGAQKMGFSMISITSGTQGSGWQAFTLYTKPAKQSLKQWFMALPEEALNSGPGPRKVLEEGTYYGYTGLKARNYDAYLLYLEKDGTVIGVAFTRDTFKMEDVDHQKFLESFRFK